MPPKNCCHKNINSTFGFFGYMWTSHIGFFCSLTLELNYFILKEIPTNIYKLEHMKYICVEKIHVTRYEKLRIYFKTKVMGRVL